MRPPPAVPLVGFLLIAVPFAARLPLLRVRAYDPDELQHMHAAWCIARGLLPYRDYFDHHTPWVHYLLAPLLAVFDVDRDMVEAVRSLHAARLLMWLLTGALLVLTFRLGRRWAGPAVAWTGTLFLATTTMFVAKSLEVRPDVPAALLLVAAQLAVLSAAVHPLLSGLLAGAAVMFTPKVIFALPGLALALLLGRRRWAGFLWPCAGIALPALATVAYFAARGALPQFLHCNVEVPLHWGRGSGPGEMILELFRQNPVLVLGLFGMVWRPGPRREGDAVLILPTLGFVAGLFLIPEIARQYFLLFLPSLALLSGRVLVDLTARVAAARSAALALLLVALSVYPLWQQAQSFRQTNALFLDRLAFVLRNSEPTETVMDGFSGLGVYRPHAHYYYYLLGKIRSTWPPGERRRLLLGLQSGAIKPKFVVWDDYVRTISAHLTEFLERHYAPVGRDPLRARLFDDGLGGWLLADGWEARRAKDPDDFVRAEGPWSDVLVPVREPRDLVAVIQARAQPSIKMMLSVNGRPAGSAMVGPEGRPHRFEVPASALQPGFNVFRLAYSQPAAVAVAALSLEPPR